MSNEPLNEPLIHLRNTDYRYVLLVLLAVIGFNYLDQNLTSLIEADLRSPEGMSSSVWFLIALTLLASFFFPLVIALICSFSLANNYIAASTLSVFAQKKFELGLVETLRAWGKSFLWSFLFIIPGLLKFTYYFLTPYIVFFSEKYAQGEVDALEYSKAVTKKFWWRFNGWLLVFYGIIPLATSLFFDEYKSFSIHPVTACLLSIAESGFVILFHYFISKLFLNSLKTFEPLALKESSHVTSI